MLRLQQRQKLAHSAPAGWWKAINVWVKHSWGTWKGLVSLWVHHPSGRDDQHPTLKAKIREKEDREYPVGFMAAGDTAGSRTHGQAPPPTASFSQVWERPAAHETPRQGCRGFADKPSSPHKRTAKFSSEQKNTATANSSLKFTWRLCTARRACGQAKTLLVLAGCNNKTPA